MCASLRKSAIKSSLPSPTRPRDAPRPKPEMGDSLHILRTHPFPSEKAAHFAMRLFKPACSSAGPSLAGAY